MAPIASSVLLNEREQQLRRLLLAVAKSIDNSGHATKPLELRWAGGWVRDKLLGTESHDIDVAISTMTGVQFAEFMCKYCETNEAVVQHGIGPEDIGNLHNVARNPDKSKHLETAMVKMFGLDIDFVNLRKETYALNSRNPQMEFGSAEEDALRRDATINALFYNLHTDTVEDFTGGVPDLANGLIRTPLDPLQTFLDDPLRVLRLIRFASRFNFDIDTTTSHFMADQRVLDSLKIKISRERVGVELAKMLSGNAPLHSLQLLDEIGLYRAIFTDPAQNRIPQPNTERWHVAYRCLDYLMRTQTPGSIGGILIQDDQASYLAWNLAALSPWMLVDDAPSRNCNTKVPPLPSLVAREGFKATNRLTDLITASYRHQHEIRDLKSAVNTKQPLIHERDRFGMAIRRWESQGRHWRLQILSTILVDAMTQLSSWPNAEDHDDTSAFLSGWQAFLDHLTALDLYGAPSLKKILDGHDLASILNAKPGKWMGRAMDVCIAWQLRHPGETNPEGAVEEVRNRATELGIPL